MDEWIYKGILLALNRKVSHVWWYTPVIPVFGSLRQKDHKFKASLGLLARALRGIKENDGGSEFKCDMS
jgi:hypothetical protein